MRMEEVQSSMRVECLIRRECGAVATGYRELPTKKNM